MTKLNIKLKSVMIFVITVLVIVTAYFFTKEQEENEIINSDEIYENKIESKVQTEEKNIIVHVDGAVVLPGIIELKENSRIADAIEKAGGLKEDADTSKINLAFLLEDGMKIYIPTHTEIEEDKKMEEDFIAETSTVETNNKKTKININTANQKQLEELPGIGSATALKIINYRAEKGKFKSIDDLKNVNGIGNNKLEKIKDLICVK